MIDKAKALIRQMLFDGRLFTPLGDIYTDAGREVAALAIIAEFEKAGITFAAKGVS